MKKLSLVLLCFLVLIAPSKVSAKQNIPILMYHSIDEFSGHGSKNLYVSPENFEKQMKYLRDHGYTPLTFEEWEKIHIVKKPVFITFDDGYKNNLNAVAVFRKLKNKDFKLKGTIFVISDFIGRSNRLSKADLKILANSGFISIQSHTAVHPDLRKITNYEYELKKSKEKIQKITGKPVIALAYPYGFFNNKVVEETKKYYTFGLTTVPELFSEKNMDNELYLLPRLPIEYSTTLDEFEKMLNNEKTSTP
ncbi:polysaccharide deacetylase family protein [Metabacillus fastidiosus]|nr:polysaccharide deacetylase family protein [Metabacillus fastidiosus]